MTTKSTANAAHDAARSEDARRAHAELHEYITSLERELADARGTRDESKHRCGWATRAKVAEGERDAARQLAAEREQERALVAERLATTERARNAWLDRCASMEHERDSAKRARDEAQRDRDDAVSNRDEWRHRAEVADHARATLNERLAATERRLAEVTRERDEARRDRDAADAAFAACARAAECVYEDGTLQDVRTTVAHIERLVACAEDADRVAIAESERDEARQQRDEVTRERDQAQAAERTFALRLRLVHEALGEHGATCARAQSISEVSWRAVRVAVASIVERLAEVTRERDELRDRVAIAEEERDEARQQRDEVTRERDQAQAAERTFALRLRLVHEALGDPECEVVLTSDLVTRRLHEAQEQGARWALLSSEMRLGPALVPQQAARICAKARAKGGE